MESKCGVSYLDSGKAQRLPPPTCSANHHMQLTLPGASYQQHHPRVGTQGVGRFTPFIVTTVPHHRFPFICDTTQLSWRPSCEQRCELLAHLRIPNTTSWTLPPLLPRASTRGPRPRSPPLRPSTTTPGITRRPHRRFPSQRPPARFLPPSTRVLRPMQPKMSRTSGRASTRIAMKPTRRAHDCVPAGRGKAKGRRP